MATENHHPYSHKQPRRSRKLIILAVLAIIIIALLVWLLPIMRGYSQTGVSYAARVVCACRYIGGRDMESCKTDLESGMEIVWLSDEPEDKAVSASVPLLASERAQLREGFGCVLDDESNPSPESE